MLNKSKRIHKVGGGRMGTLSRGGSRGFRGGSFGRPERGGGYREER